MTSALQIYLDITRLLTRVGSRAPTGIDRVELEYANFTLAAKGMFVAQLANKVAVVPYNLAERVIAELSESWTSGSAGSLVLARAVRAWRDQYATSTPKRLISLLSARLYGGSITTWLTDTHVIEGSWYVNVGHVGLENVQIFENLKTSKTLQISVYLHDFLPLTHPELFVPEERERHKSRVSNIDRYCDRVFVNSEYTASCASQFLVRLQPKIIEIGTNVSDTLARNEQIRQRSDFISIGTIEPRKNYLWLVEQWLKFCKRNTDTVGGDQLRIFGRIGWLGSSEYEQLDRLIQGSGRVVITTDASDAEIAERLYKAKAYLSASKVEGWGMPLAESLAIGTPVIASRVAAHKEVTRGLGEYFDLVEADSFQWAISACYSPFRYEELLKKTLLFRPWLWSKHFEQLSNELSK